MAVFHPRNRSRHSSVNILATENQWTVSKSNNSMKIWLCLSKTLLRSSLASRWVLRSRECIRSTSLRRDATNSVVTPWKNGKKRAHNWGLSSNKTKHFSRTSITSLLLSLRSQASRTSQPRWPKFFGIFSSKTKSAISSSNGSPSSTNLAPKSLRRTSGKISIHSSSRQREISRISKMMDAGIQLLTNLWSTYSRISDISIFME